MNGISSYNEVQATNFDRMARLPAGGYLLKIANVREESYDWGIVIVLMFDVADGKYKGYFKRQYDSQSDEFKKWKGTYRLNISNQKGTSEEDIAKYKRSLGFFKSQIEAIEKSNNIKIDCSKEWDVSILKGKRVGALFGNKEWEFNGKTGWFTNCDHLVEADKITSGDFEVPADKPLNSASDTKATSQTQIASGDLSQFEEIIADGEVPF